jgi:hypothetical protein
VSKVVQACDHRKYANRVERRTRLKWEISINPWISSLLFPELEIADTKKPAQRVDVGFSGDGF